MALIDSLLKTPALWLQDDWNVGHPCVCVEVKLSRNIAGMPFPAVASPTDREAAAKVVADALEDMQLQQVRLDESGGLERQIMRERRMISLALSLGPCFTWLFWREDGGLSIAVNEEDHIRIRAIRPGWQFKEALNTAQVAEAAIASTTQFAHSPKFGYLTSVYQGSGSGMRLSVLAHIPATILTDSLSAVVEKANELAIEVGGCFGDQSVGVGNFYHFFSQPVSRTTVPECVEKLRLMSNYIELHERAARRSVAESRHFLNSVGRSYGVLRYSTELEYNTAMDALSLSMLGMALGLGSRTPNEMKRLFVDVMPGHLRASSMTGREKASEEEVRAETIRKFLWDRKDLVLD